MQRSHQIAAKLTVRASRILWLAPVGSSRGRSPFVGPFAVSGSRPIHHSSPQIRRWIVDRSSAGRRNRSLEGLGHDVLSLSSIARQEQRQTEQLRPVVAKDQPEVNTIGTGIGCLAGHRLK